MYPDNNQIKQFCVESQFCIRCSSCSSLAPYNFKVGSEGSRVIKQPESLDELNACLAALTTCPASVISENNIQPE